MWHVSRVGRAGERATPLPSPLCQPRVVVRRSTMADFSITRDKRRDCISYKLEGVFNGKAAFELKQLIAEEAGSGKLELDFSRVRQFFDFGLAAFATELPTVTGPGQQVELLGLSLHHRRLLAYFGLEL